MNVREATLQPAHDAQASFLDPMPSLIERAGKMAKAAATDADGVDREARFPHKAFEVAREEKLLGVMIPVEFGGFGASIYDVTDICYTLGRACASTAMIYAMHQTKVACVIRHGHGIPWMETMMRRVGRDQWLLASSTTEGQNGGNIRSSAAAVGHDNDMISLLRDATVISYGAEADGLVTVARRANDAASSDQVLLALAKDDYALKRTLGWETLGMRGTCSTGFELRVDCPADRVFPEAYDKIHAQTMTPFAHLCWSSAWAGVATAAVERAQAFIRKAARSSGGQMPPAAAHFTAAKMSLAKLRALIASNVGAFARHEHDERALSSLDFQSSITLLKVQASELAVETVMHAMRTTGLSGYRNDGDFTMGRHLRDILSSPIMINNDRILANAATSTLMSGVPASLHD
ncbi:acyl-CoA/acyl-ACP dehydrogenase [Bradyrhizobium manausense]|uniref:acyl-CoA dehydrogenase family protein n=1 Tax=Bradyrhizobium TaxID=374 RepID=UPI001BAABA1C|nr:MULTISPECIES: acyl-CoA dehydrogenase family protein [Bradyrhizobium]MBR0829322.1 acyl-CoA/acyl-ACP dehydrogenase [Bradyrhizobium manausense]UVO29756.1 acyl-CoA/acyl-ACP dehydrogenase [Bradyrhizobium arachidis]